MEAPVLGTVVGVGLEVLGTVGSLVEELDQVGPGSLVVELDQVDLGTLVVEFVRVLVDSL